MSAYFESIICISDLQCPFQHPDAWLFLEKLKKQFYVKGKTKVINQGDEADFHNFSLKWLKNPDGLGPREEYEELLKSISILWDIFPEQDVCISNHGVRPLKSALSVGLLSSFLRSYADILEAPSGVRWADSWIYNDIMFEHGEGVSGQNAALRKAFLNRMSTSIGHQHVYGGIIYSTSKKDTIWGMNTGCLIDWQGSYAFAYSKNTAAKPTLGCGVILDNIPHFIPMILDAEGRWIGR